MLFKKIIAADSENHSKLSNKLLCGENAKLLNVTMFQSVKTGRRLLPYTSSKFIIILQLDDKASLNNPVIGAMPRLRVGRYKIDMKTKASNI